MLFAKTLMRKTIRFWWRGTRSAGGASGWPVRGKGMWSWPIIFYRQRKRYRGHSFPFCVENREPSVAYKIIQLYINWFMKYVLNTKLRYMCTCTLYYKGKVVMELSTRHEMEVHCVRARILILVDISGSMGIKYDRRRKLSKLTRMKKFAIELVDSLDDGDYASVVTFGERTNVLVPLQEINSNTRVCIRLCNWATFWYL